MVKKVNSQEFAAEAMKASVSVVDFNATWCGPCRMLAPVLEGVSEQYQGKVDFYNVDVDEAPELAMTYRINSVPCLVLLKNGEKQDQSLGFKPAPLLAEWIDANL